MTDLENAKQHGVNRSLNIMLGVMQAGSTLGAISGFTYAEYIFLSEKATAWAALTGIIGLGLTVFFTARLLRKK